MKGPLSWSHTTASIPENGLDMARSASPEERARLAALTEIHAIDRLDVRYRITETGKGRYRLAGTLHARVVQACVVTLDPVAADLDEAFEVMFWPPAALEAARRNETQQGDQGVLDSEEIEPIEHNTIDVGRIVSETLAAALDPYPRAPDAELEIPGASEPGGGAGAAPDNPFAVLGKLKEKPD